MDKYIFKMEMSAIQLISKVNESSHPFWSAVDLHVVGEGERTGR